MGDDRSMGPDEGAFVFAEDGVDFFATVDSAASYMEAVDVEDGVYEAFFTPRGERLEPRVLDEEKVALDRSSVVDLDALRSLLRREFERSIFTSNPGDPVAVANEFLRHAWEARWPRWPGWLDRRLHGTRPLSIECPTSTLRSALSGREVALLTQAVEAQAPELTNCLDRCVVELSAGDLNDLREAVAESMVVAGFGPEWEPNDFGLECEGLIDRLAPWHWGKDD